LKSKSKISSKFIFVTCQVGAESALKREVSRKNPEFHFAFSRPGLITFKKQDSAEVGPDFKLDSVFARTYGISFGSAVEKANSTDLSPFFQMAQKLSETLAPKKLRLHLWERDFHPPNEEPPGYIAGEVHREWMSQLKERILAESGVAFEASSEAQEGDFVLDLVVLEKDQLWMGCHIHSAFHSPYPGGRTPIELPEQAPSRAYLKLEEVLHWSHAPLKKGDMAVEIGSAPGGASYALLKRGIHVVGIDPAEMSPVVLKHPQFTHFRQPVGSVLREDLPQTVHWLLLDMNVEPAITLFAVDRLVTRMKDTVLGVFLTIKLNRWKLADEIPGMIKHIKAMGMVQIKVAQLSLHRQEIVIFGLTRKGVIRTHGSK
jgi:23S rRNA (cytidine2498-2'-O)-methyltransferase